VIGLCMRSPGYLADRAILHTTMSDGPTASYVVEGRVPTGWLWRRSPGGPLGRRRRQVPLVKGPRLGTAAPQDRTAAGRAGDL
jgi:hypothetical protein